MTYTITFRNKTTAGVDDQDGAALGALLMQPRKPDYVEIHGNTVRTSEILAVTKNQPTQADLAPGTTLPKGKRCRAQYSIQLEINRLARGEGGKAWPKLIRDKAWREVTRQKLRAIPGTLWCDAQANECHCDEDAPTQDQAAMIREMFWND